MGEIKEIYRQYGPLVEGINEVMHSKKLTEIPLELPNDIHLVEDESVIAKDHAVVAYEDRDEDGRIEATRLAGGVIFLTNYRIIVVEKNSI